MSRVCVSCALRKRREERLADPEKIKQKQRAWYGRHTTVHKNNYLKYKYGISFEEYTRLNTAQGGLCAICKEPCPSGKALAVDHDHNTGVVRALLCSGCNVGLGNFRERPDALRAAAEYLENEDA